MTCRILVFQRQYYKCLRHYDLELNCNIHVFSLHCDNHFPDIYKLQNVKVCNRILRFLDYRNTHDILFIQTYIQKAKIVV